MNKTISYLAIVLLILSCNQKSIDKTHVIISGIIENHDSLSENQTIQLHVNNPFGMPIEHNVYLDSNGKFYIKVKEFYPHEYYIVYKDQRYFIVYISPGDSIYIKLESELLTAEFEKISEKYKYITITGDNEKINKDYIKYMQFMEDSLWDWKKDREAFTNFNPFEYKEYIKDRTVLYSEKIDQFNLKHNTCQQFREIANNSIRYRALDDLMRYRWLHPYSNNTKRDSFILSEDYYDFLQESDFNREKEVISNDYMRFIHEYSMYFNDEALPEDTLSMIHEYFKNKERLKAYQIQLNNILTNSSGFVKQILLTSFFNSFLDWNDLEAFDTLYNSKLISNKNFSDILETRHSELLENYNNPDNYTDRILTDLKLYNNNILASIIDKYPDKVIYIDFWAPWCSPCLGQLKFANELHEKYKNKDIVFVYLANRCSEKSWKITVYDRNIKGKHFLLTDDQYNQLSDKLKISGIPHYIIIDKNGHIVNKNAPCPSDMEIISRIFDKLLNDV